MIRYALRCEHAHRFDSWFGSSADFDRLSTSGLLACSVCGSAVVEKDLMAPSVALSTPAPALANPDRPTPDRAVPDLTAPASPAEQALADLRRRIESVADNVGTAFVSEARRIHEGEAPARPIIGEASPSEAQALARDGIPVAPLPWSTTRRTN